MVKRWMVVVIAGILLLAGAMAQAQALGAGERGEAVKALQERLTQLNYLSAGQADGIFGDKTEAALRAFQAANALEESGTADEQTLSALYSAQAAVAPITLARGDKGEAVAALQRNLIFYGFLDGSADGQFGPGTQQAVKEAQKLLQELEIAAGPSGKADAGLQALLADDSFSSYISTLVLDNRGEAVKRLQQRLIALNYMDDAADGHYGEYTRECVLAFQRDQGLSVSGEADEATYLRLFARDAAAAAHPVPRNLSRGDQGRAVKAIQQRLIQWGFLAGLADEQYDDDMAAALGRLKEYLGAQGDWLGDTDTLDAQTQTRLLDEQIEIYRADVKSGSKGSQTYRLQRRLHSLYYLGAYQIDGKAGANTQAAIERFQALAGLEATGVADEATQRLLFSPEAPQDKSEYLLKIAIDEQMVYAYQLDEQGQYRQVRKMVCSTGLGSSTPKGIYRKTGPQDRWHYFDKFVCWAQYTYIIDGDIMFHSVLYSQRSESTLRQSSVYNLGSKASHGCIRLAVEDAKWIYDKCPSRTIVLIDDTFPQ